MRHKVIVSDQKNICLIKCKSKCKEDCKEFTPADLKKFVEEKK